jgi:hypothetical protein
MTFIPSPFMFVCMFRMIWRSIISRSIILGCNFAQQEPDPTQPDNVILLKCITCGTEKTAWIDKEGQMRA